MSMQLKQARARAAGDPGILGTIGKLAGAGIGLVTGGPVGAVAGWKAGGSVGGAVERAIGGGAAAAARPMPGVPTVSAPRGGALPSLPRPGGGGAFVSRGMDARLGGMGMVQQQPRVGSGAVAISPGGTAVACPSGYHANKTTYHLRDGTLVLQGTKCVRNRRRNPLNPRAADRAISRLDSTKKAMTRLNRFTIRKPSCNGKR